MLDRFLERLALDGHGTLDNDHVAPSVDMQSPLRRLRSHALDAVGVTEDDYNSGEPYGDLGKRLIEVGCLMPNGDFCSRAFFLLSSPKRAYPSTSHLPAK